MSLVLLLQHTGFFYTPTMLILVRDPYSFGQTKGPQESQIY